MLYEELAQREGIPVEQARQRAKNVMEEDIALGRVAEPDEVASVVTFLCSKRASFVTRAHYRVDGGRSAVSTRRMDPSTTGPKGGRDPPGARPETTAEVATCRHSTNNRSVRK